jgi:hypothetical protein
MPFTRKLYPNSGSKSRFFSSSGREVDLRAEFDEIVFGGPTSIPHGKRVLLRKARLDEKHKAIDCVCKSKLSKEPDLDCAFCLGEGYYWDEINCTVYSRFAGAQGSLSSREKDLFPGQIRVDSKIFYFRYDTVISYKDKIIEIQLDTEGNLVVPYFRESIYKPETIIPYRSDYGRIEYIAVHCRENDAIRLDR